MMFCVCCVCAQASLVELHMGNCDLMGVGSTYVLDCIRTNVSASTSGGCWLMDACAYVDRPPCVTSTC